MQAAGRGQNMENLTQSFAIPSDHKQSPTEITENFFQIITLPLALKVFILFFSCCAEGKQI